jgi:hypothetical protein
METRTRTGGSGPEEAAPLAAMSPATEPSAAASTETHGWARRYLGSGWRFALHLLEMVVAMIAGMAVLGVAIGLLGEPPGYSDLLARYALMGAFMSAPMVAWMRYRGHPWSDGMEMTAAMLVPMFALVIPVELGVAGYVPGLSEGSLMVLSHVAMIGGMAALMLYRFDRYVHGPHGHHA